MKRLILLLLALYSINCNVYDCVGEKNIANCSSHDVKEAGDFNCHQIHLIIDNETQDSCEIFPNSADDQKVFWKILSGFEKEALSGLANIMELPDDMLDGFIVVPDKEYYEANETVNGKYIAPSSDDMKIINTNNTCFYKFMSQYILARGGQNANITDRNQCFNTNQFPDLKNLVNCGYASVTINTKEGNPLTLNTCYYIPDNNLPNSIEKYFKYLFMDYLLYEVIVFDPAVGVSDENLNVSLLKYELTVEDKYGKKYKYTDKSNSPEVIEEGMQGDKIYETNNNVNQLKTTFINYILLLFMISLILV